MSPASFTAWLAAMKAAGLAASDAGAGRLLGVSADTVVRMKTNGADRRTALACRALIHRLDPWAEGDDVIHGGGGGAGRGWADVAAVGPITGTGGSGGAGRTYLREKDEIDV